MSAPRVFVHGNPATTAVWAPLLAELDRLGVGTPAPLLLSPPGFGAPLPPGFGATVTDYRDWLVTELEAIGEPVDLVGQDWGGGHVLTTVMARPDLVHSWVSDVPGIFEPDYVWHELAQAWQSRDGEAAVAAVLGPSLRDVLVERGVEPTVATRMAAEQDDDLGPAILRLYRSAAQPTMAHLGAHLERVAARPGLCFLPTEDGAVGSDAQRRRAARRTGATVEVLDGVGHWWMVETPDRVAAALARFWSAV